VGALRRLGAALLLALSAAPARAAGPRIAADARMDLVGLVQRLSGDPSAPRNPAADAAAARFARWAGDPAVTRLRAMRKTGFAWDAPAQYAVYLSSPPELAEVRPAPGFFADLAGGPAELEAWRAALSDFAGRSGFMAWEAARAPERERELAAARASLDGADLEAPLVALLGAKPWSSWTVAVSPFFPTGGGASWVLEEVPGRPEVTVVYGPAWSPRRWWRRSRPVPQTPAQFAQAAWPEAAFAMTYAVYEACRPLIKPPADACRGLAGLANPEDCVQQTWVRAIVARLLEERFGAAEATAYRAHWPATPYREPVARALDAYAADRVRYPDLMAAAGLLAAPFQPDRAAPACRAVDRSRWGEKVYARRLAYYLDARLEARPDPALEKTRAALERFRAGSAR
jgi:hypothetical protein